MMLPSDSAATLPASPGPATPPLPTDIPVVPPADMPPPPIRDPGTGDPPAPVIDPERPGQPAPQTPPMPTM
jgi:hypothetical protein